MTETPDAKSSVCALCGRPERLTRHHLIPRTRHRNRRVRRNYRLETLQHAVIHVCRPCHSHIHRLFSEKELEREYNTLAALQGHPDVQRFVAWIADKPSGFRPRSPAGRRRS
ncbi:MAG: hypothetical protein R6V11_08520 [Ectothiorhodospiraceae bacterium]